MKREVHHYDLGMTATITPKNGVWRVEIEGEFLDDYESEQQARQAIREEFRALEQE